MTTDAGHVRIASTQGRFVLAASVIASGMGFLDGTVVNVALRRIGGDLEASLAELQWIVNAYLLALAALILVGGSVGDRWGRRRMFLVGVVGFTVGSALCGMSSSPELLIGARIVQGVGAALLTPGSLSLLQTSFHPDDRARAIGLWSGLAGVTTAIGPFVGGWLLEVSTWQWIFWLNVPLAAVVLVLTARYVPESSSGGPAQPFDLSGAGLGIVGLGALTYAMIEAPALGTTWTVVVAAIGLAALAGFVVAERRSAHPMIPPTLFASRVFSACNALTALVYGGLGLLILMLVLQLQVVTGYSPLQAGIASLPITIVMLLGSSRASQLAVRIGPRVPITVGPLAFAAGALLLAGVDEDSSYWLGVLPGIGLGAVGLTLMVAPLTTTVLAAAPDTLAGVASGINNAVARAGSLLAVAVVPAAVGLTGDDYQQPGALGTGFVRAMVICAVLMAAGAAFSWWGLRESHRVVAKTVTAS